MAVCLAVGRQCGLIFCVLLHPVSEGAAHEVTPGCPRTGSASGRSATARRHPAGRRAALAAERGMTAVTVGSAAAPATFGQVPDGISGGPGLSLALGELAG